LDWAAVIKAFDWPDRHGVDTATLKLLIAILLNCPRDAEPHAVTGFWSTWSNPMYQLRLLDALLSLPADTFNFVSLPGCRVVTVDDVAGASPTIKSLAANVQGHTWNSLDLFEVLVRLADSESVDIRNCVREMLEKAVKISAELVHMGLLQVPVGKTNITHEISADNALGSSLERDAFGILAKTSRHVFGRSSKSSACVHANMANRTFVPHRCVSGLL
jgi:CCR4-NOT transcription complex subunit 1